LLVGCELVVRLDQFRLVGGIRDAEHGRPEHASSRRRRHRG
jgi:hypothetical protein